MTPRTMAAAAALLCLTAPGAAAQLPNPSAAGLGMGESYTALARGFAAVAWNPANLALADGPPFSLALLPAGVVAGLGPVTLADLDEYENRFVPAEVREGWLRQITAEGGERGSAGVDVTYLAGSVGRVGFQLGSRVRSRSRISPDAAELLLFGNAGRGEPRDLELAGSSLDLSATSTAALAYAHPFTLGPAGGRLAAGVTVKYTVGHAMAAARDRGSRVGVDELELRFPAVHSDTTPRFDNGSGVGVDLGVSWQRGAWTASAVMENVVNTFRWDAERMFFRPGEAHFSGDSTRTRFDPQPLSEAPAELRALVDEHRFARTLGAAAALRVSPRLRVGAEVRAQLDDRLAYRSAARAGVGVEARPVHWLPLHGGVALTSDGVQLAGGAGVELGALHLGGALSRRADPDGTSTVALVTLSLVGRAARATATDPTGFQD